MIIIALNTGLRIGELQALRWADVHVVLKKIRVTQNNWKGQIGTPKSGKNRDIPLNQTALNALESLKDQQHQLVFCKKSGQTWTYRQCNYALEKACKNANISPIQWHTLRRTFPSYLIIKGVSLKAVQELLGHSTQLMTKRYAHLTPNVRYDAVSILDQPYIVHNSNNIS